MNVLQNWIKEFEVYKIGDKNAEVSNLTRSNFTEQFAIVIADMFQDELKRLNLSEDDENIFYGLADGITGYSIRNIINGRTSLKVMIETDLETIDERILTLANFVYNIAKKIDNLPDIK